ncbi:hypothetical protein B1987_07980 [Mycobacterium kansasii]|uniref:PE-PGRS family protein PE_PGRS18 n=1 Tax=Mycobacterium attenuatum TaxID=2341086 RepID=A0A498QBV9_9MYCO|nr:YncE family protein [Mycobacterium attenuatum]ORB83753.1 hypothetical protein B1987_07980 [Mycobacterium kansasii]VBA41875.1 hypothetical protein LAUMK136_04279 [Mycobacterium attenuatum]
MSDVKGRNTGRDDRDGGQVQLFESDTKPHLKPDLTLDATPELPAAVEIRINNGPIAGMDMSLDGSRLLVTNYGDNSVSLIDTDTCRVVETIAGITEPFAIATGRTAADRAYVSIVSPSYDSIGVIDTSTNTLAATHPLTLSISDLTVDPGGSHVYASRNGARGADVAVLDVVTGQVEAVDIASAPGVTAQCVRSSADGSRLYVALNGPSGGQLVVVATRAERDADRGATGRSRWRRKNPKSTNGGQQGKPQLRVVGAVDIGSSVRDIAVSPDGTTVYVASCSADFGAVVDVVDVRARKVTATRKIEQIGGLVTRLTLGGDGDRAYLVSEDRVTVLNTLTQDIVGTVRADQPSCVIESRDGSHLYIADYLGTVTLVPVAATIPGTDDSRTCDSTEWIIPELLQYEAALA